MEEQLPGEWLQFYHSLTSHELHHGCDNLQWCVAEAIELFLSYSLFLLRIHTWQSCSPQACVVLQQGQVSFQNHLLANKTKPKYLFIKFWPRLKALEENRKMTRIYAFVRKLKDLQRCGCFARSPEEMRTVRRQGSSRLLMSLLGSAGDPEAVWGSLLLETTQETDADTYT